MSLIHRANSARKYWAAALSVGTVFLPATQAMTSEPIANGVTSAPYVKGHTSSQSNSDAPVHALSVVSLQSSPSDSSRRATPPHQSWLPTIRSSMESLDPGKLPAIVPARNELDASLSELERFLDKSPQRKKGWVDFLQLDALKKELAADRKNVERLWPIEKNFRQNFLGLELKPFRNVRDALNKYILAELYSADPTRTVGILSNRLSLLAEQVQAVDVSENYEARRSTAQTYSFLTESNQESALSSLIQSSFARPNLRVLVSSAYVQQRFGRGVSEYNPVCEEILGTRIVGSSWLNGSVSPTLVNNPHQATVRLQLFGDFTSDNVGYNRGVKLYTQGSANVFASETIALGEHGLFSHNDTSVQANLSSRINDIDANLRIIERIAAKTAAKQKPQADAIARSRMETRIRDQFHQQLSQQLVEANEKVTPPQPVEVVRLGLSQPARSSWSSTQFLSLLWTVKNGKQLTAPNTCPHAVPNTGMAIQVHESAIANFLAPILAGRILRSEDAALYRQQFGPLADAAVAQEDSEPWAVTLATFQPVDAEFHDGKITLRVRTTKLDRGDRALNQSADISATYVPDLSSGKLQLVRDGEVSINFHGNQQTGVRASALRTFLKRKFDEVFREELLKEPLNLADRLPPDMQNLRIASYVSDRGWLQVHLD